jgi:hypothetical protein
MAELKVLTAKKADEVVSAYRKTVAASRRNTFFLQSSLSQLEMFKSLEIRPDFVEAGFQVISDELNRMQKEEPVEENIKPSAKILTRTSYGNGFVFLFTGYMVNNPKKSDYHFPPEKEQDIRKAICAVLDKYNTGNDALAITPGMDAGSQIIFVESCIERGIPVRVYLPTFEAPYVRDFVSPGGEQWVERFYKLRNHPLVDEFYQPEQVGLPIKGDNVYERNNRWALYSSLVRGIDKVRLIALWDGKTEASSDLDAYLVKHMVDLMRDTGGIIEQVNPYKVSFFSTTDDDLSSLLAESTITKKKHVSKRKS